MEQSFKVLCALQRGTPQYGPWVIACLAGAWSKLLGDKLAEVCRPARFDGSKLVVEILDRDWTGAVKSVQTDLLKRLQEATGGQVKTIAVVVAPSTAAGATDRL